MARRRNESRAVRVGRWLLAPLIGWALRALGATWRVEVTGDDPFARPVRPPILAAIWHEDVLVAATLFRDTGAVVPVSRSRDGEHITAVMRHLGLGEPPRGSSSRGGSAALRGVVRALRSGDTVAVLIDGPRGPWREAKPGIVAAARLAGEPILPLVVEARPRVRFGSWDRTQLPLPFARLVAGWGDALAVDPAASEAEREALRLELEQRMAKLRDGVRGRLAGRA